MTQSQNERVESKQSTRPKTLRGILLGLVPFLFAAAIIYAPAIFTDQWLASGDNLPAWNQGQRAAAITGCYGDWRPYHALGFGIVGRSFHPLRFLNAFVSPWVFNVGSFFLSSLLLYLATVYWLRSCGLKGWAVYIPAVWLVFCGYGFSLISAGHRAIFFMLPWALLVLGAVRRALLDGRIFHFCLAAVAAAWGLGVQPDIMGLFGLLTICYGVYLLVARLHEGAWRDIVWRRRFIRGVIFGGLVALVMFAPIYKQVRRVTLPNRISNMGQTAEEKWIFATNWSLPPEDALEFVAPCIRGIETVHDIAPYAGRLGRTKGWKRTRAGFRNFRQHTVYLGAVALLLALYGALSPKRRRKVDAGVDGEEVPSQKWFWSSVLVIALLFSMGRHLPFYRLFYALPYFSKIRCPVKFLHLVDVAVCYLFAVGLSRLPIEGLADWQKDSDDGRRSEQRRLSICIIIGALLTAGAALVLLTIPSMSSQLKSGWSEMGLGNYIDGLLASFRGGWLHMLMVAGAGTAVLGLIRYRRLGPYAHRAIPLVMFVVVVWDLAAVQRRYIRVTDMSAFYAPSRVAETVANNGGLRLSYRISGLHRGDPLWMNLHMHGVEFLEPLQGKRIGKEFSTFAETFQRDPLRLWTLTSTGFIVGQADQLQPLTQHPDVSIEYGLAPSNRQLVPHKGNAPGVLLRYRRALPRVGLFHKWRRVATPEAALDMMKERSWNPHEELVISGSTQMGGASASSPADSVSVRKKTNNYLEVDCSSREGGVLLVTDHYDPYWRVWVDGAEQTLLRCNYLMRGVQVPPGKHTITFRYYPNLSGFLGSLAVSLGVMGWGALRSLRTTT